MPEEKLLRLNAPPWNTLADADVRRRFREFHLYPFESSRATIRQSLERDRRVRGDFIRHRGTRIG
jgi:hypothetical protein